MSYKTALFNKVSPNYPNVDETYVDNYWKNNNTFVINNNLNREELFDLENYLKNGNVSNIVFGENVDLDTIEEVNKLLKSVGKGLNILLNPNQVLNRTFTERELKDILSFEVIDEDKFFIKEILLGSSASLREFKSYEGVKRHILEVIKEFELTPLESAEYIYGYVRDNFLISDDSYNFYQTISNKKGNENSINFLLYTLLRNAGLNANINEINGNYFVSLNIHDDKYGVNGEYPLDVLTDINIKNIVGSDNLYAKFLEGLDKELLEISVESLNRKIKSLKSNVLEEKEVDKDEVVNQEVKEEENNKKNNIDVIMDHTMTFAIPVEEIKKASQEYDKKSEVDFSVLLCSDFMQREGIIDEKTFGEFLIRYGASSKLVNTIMSSSNYVGFLKEKENCKIHFKNKELYIPTTENDNHTLKIIINDDQTFSVVSCEYSNFMDSGLRYGSASVLDFYLKEDGTVLLNESVSKLSEVTDITPEMILPVYNVYARKQSIEYDINNPKVLALEEVSLVATRDEGKLISSNIDEKYKMDKARTLGFDEKYYTKKKIAGLNKYSDGREVYMTEEDLEELDETGYIVSNEAVLVKTSGKVNVLLVSMIVGFVIGIGIAFSLFIINIG